MLGDTLGTVIRTQGGEALFETVERMRHAAKQARSAQSQPERERAARQLTQATQEIDGSQGLDIARAFTLYFQLVNIAEDVHRTRELRRRSVLGGDEAIDQSYATTLSWLEAAGASREEVLESIAALDVRFVFTAHPTEARRRTTERLLSAARQCLEELDRGLLTPGEQRQKERRLHASIEALWQHAAERDEKPQVLDEVKAGLWYVRHVLMDVVPRLRRRLHRAFCARFGPIDPLELPISVNFGSWMGSDRDGNPFVTDAITEATLDLQRFITLDRYARDLDQLIDPLAAVASRLPADAEVYDALARCEAAVPELSAEAHARNPSEPLRRLVTLMRTRIDRTRARTGGAYATPEAFVEDLQAIRSTLRAAGAHALADDQLLDLMIRVRCFRFTLAALDVREDARAHHAALAEIFERPNYATLPDAEKRALLAAFKAPAQLEGYSDATRRVLACFENIARLHTRFGTESVPTYAISQSERATDVLEVLTLARAYGCDTALDIVPLLEDPSTLARAESILGELFEDGSYRKHLSGRGDIQELLVGYSDSMKQGGMLASRVRVLEAQQAALRVSRAHGLSLRVFHGRGGSVSRGGGPTYRAIDAMPRNAITPRVKFTEQGEVRAFHFAQPDLAARYIEQTVGALLKAVYESRHPQAEAWTGETETLRALAEHSQAAYTQLIEQPSLLDYYTKATPLEHVTSLNIASRPSKRRAGALKLSDLRAIPWVFAWAQARHVITGWFGVGSALEAMADADRPRLLEALEHSAFFRDIVDNVAMVLAKSDFGIAAQYAQLAGESGRPIFDEIHAEYLRTVHLVLDLTDETSLLDHDRTLQASIRRRNPYVDPLSYLQLEALRRLRAADCDDRATWQRVGRVTVHGIAAGIRNTG